MVFTEPLLYLAFMWSEIGKLFSRRLVFIYHLDNILEIYFDNFFEFARKMKKIYLLGHILSCISKFGHMPKTVEKH